MRARVHRKRRVRRTNKQVLKFGPKAKSKHRSRKGRSGDRRKRRKSRQ